MTDIYNVTNDNLLMSEMSSSENMMTFDWKFLIMC